MKPASSTIVVGSARLIDRGVARQVARRASWCASAPTSAVDPEGASYPQLLSAPPAIGTRIAVPVPFGRLVDACLHREPDARPTLRELIAGLRAWLAASGSRAVAS